MMSHKAVILRRRMISTGIDIPVVMLAPVFSVRYRQTYHRQAD